MIDGQTKAVLDALKKLTEVDGVYKVIEAEEIIELLPSPLTKLQLSSAIRDLRDREYVKVKYFTPDEYCLSTTRIIEDVVSHEEEEVTAVAVATPQAPQVVEKPVKVTKAFVTAFFGAFLGGSIVMAIAIILLKFVF